MKKKTNRKYKHEFKISFKNYVKEKAFETTDSESMDSTLP